MATPSTLITSPTAQITHPPHFDLHKRAGECGNLQGLWPNAVAPTCAGTYSKCTFSAGQQGCCDSANNCQFFTSCNGGLASGTARCTAAQCLQCLPEKPYCTQYLFSQGVMAYSGYACGTFSIPDSITVQGIVSTGQPISIASSVSASTTSSRIVSNTSQTSRSTGPSSVTPTTTANAQPLTASGISVSKGIIIGIAVGGFVFLVLFAILIWFCCRRRNRQQKPMLEPMRQQ